MNSKSWYKEKYGEDWWELVYEQDLLESRRVELFQRQLDKAWKIKGREESWAFNEISGQ